MSSLPDRSVARPEARRRGSVQPHARSHRPSWHAWRTTPPIKARLLHQAAAGRPGRDRRRRSHYASAIFTQLSASAAPAAWPVSVGKVLGRGIFVVDGALYDAQGGRATQGRWTWRRAAHLPGAHNWQNAALAYAATKPFVKRCRAPSPPPSPAFPAWRIAWKMSAASARCASSTIPRRPMPTPRRGRWPVYPDIFWIAGGKRQGRRHRKPCAAFSAHPQGLSDRRGGARVLPAPSTARCRSRSRGTLEAAVASRLRRCRSAPRSPRRWCCCRRPAPPSTSSRISSSAAMTSAPAVRRLSSRRICGRRHDVVARRPLAASPIGGARWTGSR